LSVECHTNNQVERNQTMDKSLLGLMVWLLSSVAAIHVRAQLGAK
jgi:hypothetical protein